MCAGDIARSHLCLQVLGTVKNTLLAVWTVVFLGEVVTGTQGGDVVLALH
jgi:hypothetical protein